MKYKVYLKLIFVFVVISLLFCFTSLRNEKRLTQNITVNIVANKYRMITDDYIKKMLIQKTKKYDFKHLNILSLDVIEKTLNSDGMIRQAEAYKSIDGRLNVTVMQKTPIARILDRFLTYMDSEGNFMYGKGVFSPRLILVKGIKVVEDRRKAYGIIQYIINDEFLKKNIVGLEKKNNDFFLKLRLNKLLVNLGDDKKLDTKFLRFKAFYKKGRALSILNKYKILNLKFENQIVGIK